MTQKLQNSHNVGPRALELFWPALGLLMISVLSAAAFNALRPEPLPWNWRAEARLEREGFAIVDDPNELQELLGQPGIAVLDARNELLYEIGHIPGATSLPAEGLAGAGADYWRRLPEAEIYVVYCSEELCPLAGKLAEALAARGLSEIYVFVPGFDVWLEDGRPVETGKF
ncbi:MAG: rhodanese-like domain-containing protein [Deltaproteobacteria bacterium]|nr:rhodanese-like domain-containing protein [Deltaproteobacteria bacterium]